jgi:hypothetical protein
MAKRASLLNASRLATTLAITDRFFATKAPGALR